VSICTEAAFTAAVTSSVQSESEGALEGTHPLCDTVLLSSQFRDSMLTSVYLATSDDDNGLHGMNLISVASPRPPG
jgi:hypothetical protein